MTSCPDTQHDVALTTAIVGAAQRLRFNNRPGSLERQCTLGLLVAAISDRLILEFPCAAAALEAAVFSEATVGNPTEIPHTLPSGRLPTIRG